jgi:hypothetical protein
MFAGRSEAEARAFEEAVFAPVGAMVMGRRMADLGIGPWADDPTFHMPVFVVTHHTHDPIVKDGGATYSFVTGGLDRALDQARAAAGDKDIAIGAVPTSCSSAWRSASSTRSGCAWFRCCWVAGFGCSTTGP